ncbi:MAG TPA: histidinol-phosphatase HisJ family protein [Firmicutes bacterium]|nr:histidinol-phosphatase HisJ family protein [Bacillota bacterium]
MIDYHIHTSLCGHASGTLSQYLVLAREKGLQEIGFADHFPLGLLGYAPRNKVTMEPEELAGYMAEVRQLNGRFPEVTVRLGVEVDFLPGKSSIIAKQLAGYSFDYVIGSVHFIEGWDFTHPDRAGEYEDKDLRELYDRYFNLVWEACRSGLFDIIGHVDVIKKFGYALPEPEMEAYWVETARVLKQTGTCLELNTAGRDAPVKQFYPGYRGLEICFQEGVPITLGSDAHAPQQVGRYFTEALELLRRAGYQKLTGFSRRRQLFIDLG